MKRLSKILSVGLFAMMLFVVTGCKTTDLNITKPAFESSEEVYAFSALSATSLLHEEVTATTLTLGNLSYSDNTIRFSNLVEEEGLVVEEEIDELNKYLNIMEKFLGTNNSLGVNVETSDFPEFQNKLVFVTKNLLGEDVTYEIFYNEVELQEKDNNDEVTTPEENVEEKDEDEKEKEEVESELQGMMIIDGVQYVLEGKKEYEDHEEKITIKSYIDEENYVKVKYQIENEERKFKYEVKVNGVVTSLTEVKVEEEDNETKVKLEFVDGEAKGKYEFKREAEDGHEQIKIKYEVTDQNGNTEKGEMKVYVIVDELTGETSYQYIVKSDDHDEVREFDKDRDEDEDERDEDEDEKDDDEKDEDEKDEDEKDEDDIEDHEDDESEVQL